MPFPEWPDGRIHCFCAYLQLSAEWARGDRSETAPKLLRNCSETAPEQPWPLLFRTTNKVKWSKIGRRKNEQGTRNKSGWNASHQVADVSLAGCHGDRSRGAKSECCLFLLEVLRHISDRLPLALAGSHRSGAADVDVDVDGSNQTPECIPPPLLANRVTSAIASARTCTHTHAHAHTHVLHILRLHYSLNNYTRCIYWIHNLSSLLLNLCTRASKVIRE